MMLQKKRKQDFTTMKERQKSCSSTLSPGKNRWYCAKLRNGIDKSVHLWFFHDFYMTYDALDLFFIFLPTKKVKERVDIWGLASMSEGTRERLTCYPPHPPRGVATAVTLQCMQPWLLIALWKENHQILLTLSGRHCLA